MTSKEKQNMRYQRAEERIFRVQKYRKNPCRPETVPVGAATRSTEQKYRQTIRIHAGTRIRPRPG